MVKLGELKASIQNHGLIHPIVVRPCEGGYEVVAGMRRVIACQQLGHKTIRAEIRELDDDEAEYVKLSENIHREDVSQFDQGRFFVYLKERFGLNDQEIADQIGKSRAYVTQRLLSLKWPSELIEDVELGHMPWSTAMALARLEDPAKLQFYRFHATEQQASTAQVVYWVNQELARPPLPERAEAEEDLPPLPPSQPPPVMCIGCDRQATRGAPWRYVPLCPECTELIRTVRQEMERLEGEGG
jgi:ParB/RepB/Spo0J family partition protein